jgi:hypothetical protein
MKQLQLKLSLLSKVLVVAYSIFYIATSFFIPTESVLMQTVNNLLIIALIMALISKISFYNPTLKPFLYAFWIGQAGMYLVNFLLYDNLLYWYNNFNDFGVLIPVYLVSIFIGIVITWKK